MSAQACGSTGFQLEIIDETAHAHNVSVIFFLKIGRSMSGCGL